MPLSASIYPLADVLSCRTRLYNANRLQNALSKIDIRP